MATKIRFASFERIFKATYMKPLYISYSVFKIYRLKTARGSPSLSIFILATKFQYELITPNFSGFRPFSALKPRIFQLFPIDCLVYCTLAQCMASFSCDYSLCFMHNERLKIIKSSRSLKAQSIKG